MKVLKDNYCKEPKKIESYPKKLICESCRSELEYEESDLRMGFLGCVYVDCPVCGRDNMLEENEKSIILTKDNVEFPIHFLHISEKTGAVNNCNNKYIKECIEKAINYFRNNKNEYVWFIECGNLYITVYRNDGDEEYYVTVTNDYYSTYIPFEDKDYEVVDFE